MSVSSIVAGAAYVRILAENSDEKKTSRLRAASVIIHCGN